MRQKTQMMRNSTNCTYKFKLAQIMGKVWTCFFVGFSFLFLSGAQIEIEAGLSPRSPIFISKGAVFFISKDAHVFVKKNGVVQKITNHFLEDSASIKKDKNFEKNRISKIKNQDGVKEAKLKSVPTRVSYVLKSSPATDYFQLQSVNCALCILILPIHTTGLQSDIEFVSKVYYYSDTYFTNHTQSFLKQDYHNWIQSRPPPIEA